MNNETVNLLVSKIEQLVVAGNGKIEAFFPLVVKQQVLRGWIEIIPGALLFLLSSFSIAIMIRNFKKAGEEIPFGIVLSILVLILGLTIIFYSITRILNPEYYAVKELIDMVK